MNISWRKVLPSLAVIVAAAWLVMYVGLWQWMYCRVYVPPGKSLLLRYKGPWPFGGGTQAPEGSLVALDAKGRPAQVGILEAMPGPGRHFYSPLEYEMSFVDDIVVKPGEIGLVTAKVGKDLPSGSYLADEGYKGTRRKVLTPGRYRINPYGFEVKALPITACVGTSGGVLYRRDDATLIPPGYVGVVTNKQPKDGEPGGILPDVLQPGIYYLNPVEKRIDIVSVGFNEMSLAVEMVRDANGRVVMSKPPVMPEGVPPIPADPMYVDGKGVQFPSSEGFPIHMDFTAIWGVLPDQAPDVVRQFGEVKDVEQKVILPQIQSVLRLQGSKRGAVELLVGETREAFQTDTAEELDRILEAKNLKLLFGLTRHIYVPAQVREPIQQGKIAEELRKTREQEMLTQKAAADLAEAKQKVIYEQKKTEAETEKLVAELKAEGDKQVAEISAETERLAAKVDAETAIIQAQITKLAREADATKVELTNQARAELDRMSVDTLGGPEAYNRYIFAEKLPSDLRLGIFYAGPGTFWTDLKGVEQIMTGKILADGLEKAKPADPKSAATSSADRR